MSEISFSPRRIFSVFFYVKLCGFFALASSASAAQPPNLILITADDAGLQLGCYGDPYIQTPHLDRLAAEGVRFERAFVPAASCSPSRAAILTGRYPHQNGQIGLSHRGFEMHRNEIGFPALLKKAGYRTGVIGKIHVQPFQALGFDFMTGGFDFPKALRWNSESTRDVRRTAEEARKFIGQEKERPFFLMVNYLDPHEPFLKQVKGLPQKPLGPGEVKMLEFIGVEATPERMEKMALFYNCTQRLDDGIGLLMEALRESGQAEDTLVIFLSDHGPPFPRAKTSCYEAGLQVPFIVRWPGTAKPGQVRPEFVSALDILPTMLEAAGVPVPGNVEGESLTPLLRGEPAPEGWRKLVFGEMNFHSPDTLKPMRSVRDDRYKLIVNLPPLEEGREFYDLETDPMEFKNLAGQPAQAENEARLTRELQKWREVTEDPLLSEDIREKWLKMQKSAKKSGGD